MMNRFYRCQLVIAGLVAIFLVGCKGDGLDSPDEIVQRAKALCACESKECMDKVTDEITAHTEKVKEKYPVSKDVPEDIQAAMSEGQKTMLGCIHKLDQLSGHAPPEPTKTQPVTAK